MPLTNDSPIADSAVRDLLKTTMENLPMAGEFEVLLNRNDHPMVNYLWSKRKRERSGTSITRLVHLGGADESTWVELYESKSPAVVDKMVKINMPWRRLTEDYSYERRELLENREPARLVESVKTRRTTAMLRIAESLETKMFSAPSATNVKLPHGVRYFIVPITAAQGQASASGESGGFQGQHATGFSTCAGLDASTAANARWRNWNDRWDSSDGSLNDTDLKRVSRMLRKLKFNPPKIVDATSADKQNIALFVGEELLYSFEDRARKGNQQHGPDVLKYQMATYVLGTPLLWAEELDFANDATYPMIASNLDYFYPVTLEGDELREGEPMNTRELPNVWTINIDLSINWFCSNRQRAGGMISYVAYTG